MSVFFFFALATVVGSLSTLFWIPEDDLGRGYFQMNALIVLGLLALVWAVVLLPPLDPFGAPGAGRLLLASGTAGSALYYGAIFRERWRASRWAAALALAGCAGALVLATRHLIHLATPLPYRDPLAVAGLLTSALLLGWSLIAMLLGHWYLVAPRLTFRHLVVFCWVLLGAVVLRLAVLGATLAAAISVDELVEPHPWRVLTSVQGQGMFFWFRLAWGLLIPLALAVMSLHCARQRSNQSATGILYVLVVGTTIGEITAYYLAVTTGIPA
ncbi:MAG TPA: hypothetical protein VMS86_01435 [Thermoanaerobaculia bacterium]|nr:hypothetical protein [Thermoanaerobaculia bacterium]